MTHAQRVKRFVAVIFWRVVNPPTRLLAGRVPWWVLVETTGRTTGKRRRTPLATGPYDDAGIRLIAAHGRHASWVKNLEAKPEVRVLLRGRWRDGTAAVEPLDPELVSTFNVYARQARGVVGIDPVIVSIRWR